MKKLNLTKLVYTRDRVCAEENGEKVGGKDLVIIGPPSQKQGAKRGPILFLRPHPVRDPFKAHYPSGFEFTLALDDLQVF
jgi:hypothetical protein